MKGLELYIRDKNGNVFVQKKTNNGHVILDLLNEIQDEVYTLKPRHIIMKLNEQNDNSVSERYQHGIKITKKVAKKQDFDFESVKKLRKDVKGFLNKKTKQLGEDHPISDFLCKCTYKIFIDQKKEKVSKSWKNDDVVNNNAENPIDADEFFSYLQGDDEVYDPKENTKQREFLLQLLSVAYNDITGADLVDYIREKALLNYHLSGCVDGKDFENWKKAEDDVIDNFVRFPEKFGYWD